MKPQPLSVPNLSRSLACRTNTEAVFAAFHIVLPIIIGGLIYILWRDPNLLMFDWFRAVGFEPPLVWLRTETAPVSRFLPAWLIFSLPDGLWVYALTALMVFLWRDATSLPIRTLWLSLGALLGAGSELGQLAGIVPGRFDVLDLAVCIAAPLAALVFTSRKLLKESQ